MVDLISYYRQQLNLPEAEFSLIEHEDAIVALVYRLILPSAHYILKIQDAHKYRREVHFLHYFLNEIPVPRIVDIVPPNGVSNDLIFKECLPGSAYALTDQDSINVEKQPIIIKPGAVLMECLPGSIVKMADLTEPVAHQMGTLLARIHTHRTEGYGDLTRPKELSSSPVESFIERFYESLDQCNGHLQKELIEKAGRYFDEHVALLNSIDGPCIIHRDYRPGNVIAYNGKLQGIIDWASARSGFAEEDFCPMEHDGWPSEKVKQAFLTGYATIRSVPNYERLMPLLRISRAIASLDFMLRTGTWQTRSAAFYQLNLRFLETL